MPSDADPSRERRRAGLASNNLEASLQRALHEPRRGQRDRLQAVLTADATLRRIAGRLTAIFLQNAVPPAPQAGNIWIVDALEALASGAMPARRPHDPTASERLDRLIRQVELLAFTLHRGSEPS